MATEPRRDLFHSILSVTIIGLLVATSFLILKPFLPALIWATMVAVATWPMMLAVQARLWRKRWLAVVVMTVGMLLVFVVPFSLAIGTLVSNMDTITGWVKSFDVRALGTPPEWVAKIPMVGAQMDSAWRELASSTDLGEKFAPIAGEVAAWLLGQLGSFGAVALQFLLTVAITAILYAKGEVAASGVLRFARRVGGDRGEGAVVLAGKAIRGVAMGVVVTALIQAIFGGVGLAIAGVPYAAVLTAAMFMLAVAQIGAAPVLFCCVIWVFWNGETGWGIALLVWSILVSVMDNVLRPVLIRRGVELPMLVIFVGVIGGIISMGLVGIFVGPIVLAVMYTILGAWISEPELVAPQELPSAKGQIATKVVTG
jgi:predicted PurR-regulated permease PerM